jgi:hypothetical protein
MTEFGGNTLVYFNPNSPDDFFKKLKMAAHNEDMMLELS